MNIGEGLKKISVGYTEEHHLYLNDNEIDQILSHLLSQIEQMGKPSTWRKETMDFHAGYYTATRDIRALFGKEVKNG